MGGLPPRGWLPPFIVGGCFAAFGDDARSRLGGFADVLGPPLCRRPSQAGCRHSGEAGGRRPYPALDASRAWVRVLGEYPLLLLFCVRLPSILSVGISARLQELGCYKPSLPPVPEDAVDRDAWRVAAEKKKEKKDAEKAWARERTRARDALERHR
jgi:hypothetical protein